MHLHPEFYQAAHAQVQQHNSMFMHPNYPFVPHMNSAQLPIHNNSTLQHEHVQQQRMQQQVRMQAMSVIQAQANPNVQVNLRNHIQQPLHSSIEQHPKRGQIVRVQIAGKHPMLNP